MEQPSAEHKYNKWIVAVSIIIPVAVAILFSVKLKDFGIDVTPLNFLPPIYATINGITKNNKAPYAPKWKFGAGVQYAIPVGSAGTLTPRLDVAYQSYFFSNIDNNPLGKVAGYTLANGRIGFADADRTWEVALAVTNIFDKYYYLNKIRYPIGIVVGQPALPREWKISVKRNF